MGHGSDGSVGHGSLPLTHCLLWRGPYICKAGIATSTPISPVVGYSATAAGFHLHWRQLDLFCANIFSSYPIVASSVLSNQSKNIVLGPPQPLFPWICPSNKQQAHDVAISTTVIVECLDWCFVYDDWCKNSELDVQFGVYGTNGWLDEKNFLYKLVDVYKNVLFMPSSIVSTGVNFFDTRCT